MENLNASCNIIASYRNYLAGVTQSVRLGERAASLTRISAYHLRVTWQTGRYPQWQKLMSRHRVCTLTQSNTATHTVNKPSSLLNQGFQARLNPACIPGWEETIVPLWFGELRLICTCSSATSSHTPASLNHWVRQGSTDTGPMGSIWTDCPDEVWHQLV